MSPLSRVPWHRALAGPPSSESEERPAGQQTSGLCEPSVGAVAEEELWERGVSGLQLLAPNLGPPPLRAEEVGPGDGLVCVSWEPEGLCSIPAFHHSYRPGAHGPGGGQGSGGSEEGAPSRAWEGHP